MDKYEKQRRIFTIVALLLLLSVVSLIAVIPRLFQEASSGEIPKEAAIATLVGMGVHLLLFFGFLLGIRLAKLRRRINREINLAAAVVILLPGFIVMDGAVAYINQLPFVSTGMFLCVFGDFAAAVVSVAALFILRKKKKKELEG
jgi:O-antigen/teichoic acid export membrane protein